MPKGLIKNRPRPPLHNCAEAVALRMAASEWVAAADADASMTDGYALARCERAHWLFLHAAIAYAERVKKG